MAKPASKRKDAAPASGKPQAVEQSGRAVPDADALPGPEEMEALLRPVRLFAQSGRQARVRGFLSALVPRPPQVLLLEGGTAEERLAAALYWALSLNCTGQPQALPVLKSAAPSGLPGLTLPGLTLPPPAAEAVEEATPPPAEPPAIEDRPCFACAACRGMAARLHRDLFFFDGLAASIKIAEVRELLPVLGEPPREALYRVVILAEAQQLVEAAANALLKSLEEPKAGTVFLLLAPQRERLLPTLVSRSFVLTLPWPASDSAPDQALIPWERALTAFLATGAGWFDRTASRGAVDPALAQGVCSLCRKALAAGLAGRVGENASRGLEGLLVRLPAARLRMVDEVLAECQDSLLYAVNPALVLDWLATRLYLLMPR